MGVPFNMGPYSFSHTKYIWEHNNFLTTIKCSEPFYTTKSQYRLSIKETLIPVVSNRVRGIQGKGKTDTDLTLLDYQETPERK